MTASDGAHRQTAYDVRFDWGLAGAAAVAGGADVAVVVDVLSFTTAVCVAVERGATVLPFAWKDERAVDHARRHGATLAMGRAEARAAQQAGNRDAVSLSPASMTTLPAGARVVLPSPNGSTVCADLAERDLEVVAASLRNRSAVARWLATGAGPGRRIAVVAAGERWPEGSLRPAAEDLWGAGAALAALVDLGVEGLELSPEATLAEHAFRAVAPTVTAALHDCASGRELVDRGFADDVAMAADLDSSAVVPVLRSGEFVAADPR